MPTLPPLPFEAGDTANIGCVIWHQPMEQHTLTIDRDEESTEADEIVNLTIVMHGQPVGDITVKRAELAAALGYTS
jgi:hypothetical protein